MYRLPILAAAALALAPARPAAADADRPFTSWTSPAGLGAAARVALAHARKDAVVRDLLAAAGVAWPPDRLLFRVFKQEHELEVWAAARGQDALRLVATYGICALSGGPGPKDRQGDGQVPEGFYRVTAFNPASRFHLSLQVGYPNAVDRARSPHADLGGAIMIHGNCVSIGCIAVTDDRIQELWVMAEAARGQGAPVHVHLFPGRDLDTLIAGQKDASRREFWETLRTGRDRFDRTRRLPVAGRRGGRYEF